MKHLLLSLLSSLLLVSALGLGACSGGDDSAETTPAGAYERGLADAKALSHANYTTERDLHSALLAVKSREWQLREKGDHAGADAYIDGFRQYLTEHDKPLANKLF